MARLSVVVPVYNVEDCLPWCLDSLEVQTLSDIEILCVNDGSTDGSRSVLASYADRDARIRVIDKPNGGLSSARNAGIDAATAPYVSFLDSDDRYTSNACERIVAALDETGADVLTFGANPYPAEDGYPWLEHVLSPRDVVYDAFSMDLVLKESSLPFSWRTACRTDFLRESGIAFEQDLRFGEDQVFAFAVYPRSSKTALISDKLYDYRVSRPGSLMDRLRATPGKRLMEHVTIAGAIFADWQQAGFLHEHAAGMAFWLCTFVLYDALDLAPASADEIFALTGQMLAPYRELLDAARADMPQAVSALIDAAFNANTLKGAAHRERLMFAFDRYRYGRKRAAGRAAKRLLRGAHGN